MKKIETKYAMRSDKFNELKKEFNAGEIDIFMSELGKIRAKTLKKIKKQSK